MRFSTSNSHIKFDYYPSGVEIRAFIEQIKPERVYPIHTEHPELFTDFTQNINVDTVE